MLCIKSLPCVKGGGKIIDFDGGIVEWIESTTNLLSHNAKTLRKNMTKEERHLWYDFLRTYPIKFLRQKILGKYIVDFYFAEAKLIIKPNGSQHYEEQGIIKDVERTVYLEQYGLKIIRIPNNQVNQNFRGVCDYIDNIVKQSLSQLR